MRDCEVVNGHYVVGILTVVHGEQAFCPVCHSDIPASVGTGSDGVKYQECQDEKCGSVYPLDLANNPTAPTIAGLIQERKNILGIDNYRAVA